MPPHLSQETRDRIVFWHYTLGLPVSEIAKQVPCSTRTVYNVLEVYRKYGESRNPFLNPPGRERALQPSDIDYIVGLLQANPSLYLDELQEHLLNQRRVNVSVATISRALRRIAFSHKSVARAALERNELLRATWQATYGHIAKEDFVWLDESGIDNLTNMREYGWSPLGRACVKREFFARGQKYSILPALTTEGIIALDIFEGSVTKERFIEFLRTDVVSDRFRIEVVHTD